MKHLLIFLVLISPAAFADLTSETIQIPAQLVEGDYRLVAHSSESCGGNISVSVDEANHLIELNASYSITLTKLVELPDTLDKRGGCKDISKVQSATEGKQSEITQELTHDCDRGIHEFYERRIWTIELNKIGLQILSSAGNPQVRCSWISKKKK